MQIVVSSCWADQVWKFIRVYESKAIIQSPFSLIASADINGNGKKEVIVADFGQYGDHIEEWKLWKKLPSDSYNLFVLEWENQNIDIKLHKAWSSKDKSFAAFNSKQFGVFQVNNHVIVETMPPYLGLEWDKGQYVLHQQQGNQSSTSLVGSWIFPWLSPSCYQGFPNRLIWPRECLVGIRDLSNDGTAEVVTIEEKNKNGRQKFRVRKVEPHFPIIWEMETDKFFGWWQPGTKNLIDRLNWTASNKLLLTGYMPPTWLKWDRYVFEQDAAGKGFRLRQLLTSDLLELESYDLPDIYLRKTHSKEVEEYWGYRKELSSKEKSINFRLLLRKVAIKSDLSGFVREDIDFPHHGSFLGVGYFNLNDIDGDGLDEVILVEETAGKLSFGAETVYYGDVNDYIHILKWDGSKYQTMWVSPPYTKRGTKFLVEDVKNTGKKQLVVLSPYGTVQIWERQ